MKNSIKKLLSFTALVGVSAAFSAQEITISKQELPAKISQFMSRHFAGASIDNITKETKRQKVEYELRLNNGTKLEFDNTTLKEVEGKEKLPDSLIPKSIKAYVRKNYPQNYITEWKMDNRKQQIELNNRVELNFSLQGQFLRIDD